MQALAAPGRLDDEHRFIERRIHRQAEGELRPDLIAELAGRLVPKRTVARRQFARDFEVALHRPRSDTKSTRRRTPPVCRPRSRIIFKKRCGGRIIADVVEGFDLRVSLHVRLACEDEDSNRL